MSKYVGTEYFLPSVDAHHADSKQASETNTKEFPKLILEGIATRATSATSRLINQFPLCNQRNLDQR
jgi:hypothetical protein